MRPSPAPHLPQSHRPHGEDGQSSDGGPFHPAPFAQPDTDVDIERSLAHPEEPAWVAGPTMNRTRESGGLRRTTGWLFIFGALAFTAAATLLAATFDWPDILRQPAEVVLPAFAAGGPSLVWTWFATAWTYAILALPILLLPAVLWRPADPVMRSATAVGATSVLLSLIGFLRWVFVVPPLAESYVAGDATTRAAIDAAWTAQHQFGGALLGEHLGQLLVIGWSITISAIIVRTRVLPRWLGVTGLAASAIYLLNQGDIIATALPGFPVWDLAGLIGSTGWGLWVTVLGVTVLLRPLGSRSPSGGDPDPRDAKTDNFTTKLPETADARR